MDTEDMLFMIKPFDSFPAERVRCEFTSYHHNGTMAMVLFCTEKGIPESADITKQYCIPYGNVTVNLDVSHLLDYNIQFVDESNLPGIGRWLSDNGIAQPTGIIAPSGYNLYQAYRFDLPEKALKEVVQRREQLGTKPPRISQVDISSGRNTPKPKK